MKLFSRQLLSVSLLLSWCLRNRYLIETDMKKKKRKDDKGEGRREERRKCTYLSLQSKLNAAMHALIRLSSLLSFCSSDGLQMSLKYSGSYHIAASEQAGREAPHRNVVCFVYFLDDTKETFDIDVSEANPSRTLAPL